MRIVWSEAARDDVREIRRSIAKWSPATARSWRKAILARVRILATTPFAGHRIDEADEDLRELVLGIDRLAYRVRADEVHILCVWDGRRGSAPEFTGEKTAQYGAAHNRASWSFA